MMDPEKLADLFSDNRRVDELVKAIHRIEVSVVAMAEKVGISTDSVASKLEQLGHEFDTAQKELDGTKKSLADLLDMSEKSFNAWERAGQRLKGVFQDAQQHMEALGRGATSLQTSPTSTMMNLVRNIPYVGPFLEFMINSEGREEAFRTMGRRSALSFQGVQALDPSTIRALGERLGTGAGGMKSIEEQFLGNKEEVANVFNTFAQGGFKIQEVMSKASELVKGFGDEIWQVSLGLDKAFGLTAGTMASLQTQLVRSTNVALGDSATLVRDIGLAARESGMGQQQFINSILQVTGALRVQGGDARGLVNAYFSLKDATKGLMTPGTTDQRLADVAGSAFGRLPQSVQAMPEGLQALVGERMAKRFGLGNLEGLDALVHFQTGFQFLGDKSWNNEKSGDFSVRATEERWRMLHEQGFRGSKLIRALMQFGSSAQEAFLVDRAMSTEGGLSSNLTQKLVEDRKKDLEVARENAPLAKSDYDKKIDELKQVMHSVGQLLFSILSAQYNLLGGGLLTIGKVLANPLGWAENKRLVSALGDMMGEQTGGIMSSVEGIMDSGGRLIFGGASNPLATAFGGKKTNEFWRTYLLGNEVDGGGDKPNKKPAVLAPEVIDEYISTMVSSGEVQAKARKAVQEAQKAGTNTTDALRDAVKPEVFSRDFTEADWDRKFQVDLAQAVRKMNVHVVLSSADSVADLKPVVQQGTNPPTGGGM